MDRKARRRRTRFQITINLGADVLNFDKSIAPDANDVDPYNTRHHAAGVACGNRGEQKGMAAMANLFERLDKGRPPQTEEARPPPTEEAKAVGSLFERLDKGRPPPTEEVIKQPRGDSPIEKLLDWLVNHWAKDTITAREIYTHGPNSIRDKKTTLGLAQILVERGWLVRRQHAPAQHARVENRPKVNSIAGAAGAAPGAAATFCSQMVDKYLLFRDNSGR